MKAKIIRQTKAQVPNANGRFLRMNGSLLNKTRRQVAKSRMQPTCRGRR